MKPGQSVPQHNANSNVHIPVVRGEVAINLDGTESLARKGSLLPVSHQTAMNIKNKSAQDASFLIIKIPNPSEMAG
ncbi:MAG: hypothetical protein KJ808_03705 [Acidobacteria bacterium]|nr:hypothetical protein [Acidobacteriota bacterium]MBU4307229.1 hypothetical protein [Acidobacteriota bacterium]